MKRFFCAAFAAALLCAIGGQGVHAASQFSTPDQGVVPGVVQMCLNSAGQAVANCGSAGKDFSANQPALPVVGAGFGSSGPYANYVLIASIPASAFRANVDVENTSGAQIVIIRDDGTGASGAAPVNASVFALAGGSGSGAQGGSWSSATFKGRLQIYAPLSSAIVTVMQD